MCGIDRSEILGNQLGDQVGSGEILGPSALSKPTATCTFCHLDSRDLSSAVVSCHHSLKNHLREKVEWNLDSAIDA